MKELPTVEEMARDCDLQLREILTNSFLQKKNLVP